MEEFSDLPRATRWRSCYSNPEQSDCRGQKTGKQGLSQGGESGAEEPDAGPFHLNKKLCKQ